MNRMVQQSSSFSSSVTRTSRLLTKVAALAVPAVSALLGSTESIFAQAVSRVVPLLSPVGLGAIAGALASVGGYAALRKYQKKPPRDPRGASSSQSTESEGEEQ